MSNSETPTCFHQQCTATENLEYMDFTVTGIGDFRYYCPDHVYQYRRAREIRDTKRTISYFESEVLRNAEKMNESLNSMKENKEKLKTLEGMNIEEYKALKEQANDTDN